MEAIGIIFVDGIVIGSSTLLLALGLSLIFGVLAVVNVAHGALFTIGAFVTYFICTKLGIHFLGALFIAFVIGFVIGSIVEKAVFFPLRNDVLGAVIASFALTFVIEVLLGKSFGLGLKGVSPMIRGTLRLGAISIDGQRLLIIAGAAILSAALIIFVHRSKIGRAIRAVAQNSELGLLSGINISFVRLVTLGIGVSFAMVAGVLMSPVSYIDPYIGGALLMQAFAAIILGGLGSIYGAVLGSVVVGFLLAIGLFFAGAWAYNVLFGAIVLVLVIRPQGIIPFESV